VTALPLWGTHPSGGFASTAALHPLARINGSALPPDPEIRGFPNGYFCERVALLPTECHPTSISIRGPRYRNLLPRRARQSWTGVEPHGLTT
jgi:hypothetical protein